ncbi:hypothetical protein D3C84_1284180 [compost metagenome]
MATSVETGDLRPAIERTPIASRAVHRGTVGNTREAKGIEIDPKLTLARLTILQVIGIAPDLPAR